MPDIENLRSEEVTMLHNEMARYLRQNEAYMACLNDRDRAAEASEVMRDLVIRYNDIVRAYHAKTSGAEADAGNR
jgi:hypothetical protein